MSHKRMGARIARAILKRAETIDVNDHHHVYNISFKATDQMGDWIYDNALEHVATNFLVRSGYIHDPRDYNIAPTSTPISGYEEKSNGAGVIYDLVYDFFPKKQEAEHFHASRVDRPAFSVFMSADYTLVDPSDTYGPVTLNAIRVTKVHIPEKE